jgi:hypothetical protein
MRKLIFFALLLFGAFGLPLGARVEFNQQNSVGKYKSWIAAPPQKQFKAEARDDEKGMARIYFPVMSETSWEATFNIYRGEKLYRQEVNMGQSIHVEPGTYDIYFGSGILRQHKMHRRITVQMGESRMIAVDWSGLIIRVINPSRKFLRENYEIFSMHSRESYGISISKDESEPGQHPDTWLLPPGLYKITKAGLPYNTSTFFATVRILPGELTQYSIVMDEITGNYLGSGILEEMATKSITHTFFNFFSALNGSFNITNNNNASRNHYITNMNISGKLDNRFQYDDKKHYFLAEPSLEIILNMEENKEPEVFADKMILNNLYIYYLVPVFGFYGRMDLNSKIFPGKKYFDIPQSVNKKTADGRIIETQNNVSSITLSPRFAPMNLKEGMGINFTPFNSDRFRLSVRGGLGFRQNIYHDVFEQSADNPDDYLKIESNTLYGLEATVWIYSRLSYNLFWTLKVDSIFPYQDSAKVEYSAENIINFRLIKYLSIEYKVTYIKEIARAYGRIENSLWIRFSYIF